MKTKVLHILGGMGRGGAPSFIINNMVKTDSESVQYDFLVRKDNCVFDDVIKKHGGNVYIVPEFPKHFLTNYFETKRFFVEHIGEYAAVHIHANALLYMLPIRLACKYWKCKVIVHSHNTQSNMRGASFIHKINRKFFLPNSCVRLACSNEAGKWLYGNENFKVINNAVDTTAFVFDFEKRKKIRGEFRLPESTVVIGNIGRFESVKNHEFMVDIFSEYLKLNKDACLLLVGDGSLKETIKQKVRALGIENKVIFTGLRKDTYNFYSAFDVFLMPSLYEGLPFTLVEAQTSGVNCLVSDNITTEVILTDLITRMSLDESSNQWAKTMYSLNIDGNRCGYEKEIIKAEYDTTVTAKILEEIYTGGSR